MYEVLQVWVLIRKITGKAIYQITGKVLSKTLALHALIACSFFHSAYCYILEVGVANKHNMLIDNFGSTSLTLSTGGRLFVTFNIKNILLFGVNIDIDSYYYNYDSPSEVFPNYRGEKRKLKHGPDILGDITDADTLVYLPYQDTHKGKQEVFFESYYSAANIRKNFSISTTGYMGWVFNDIIRLKLGLLFNIASISALPIFEVEDIFTYADSNANVYRTLSSSLGIYSGLAFHVYTFNIQDFYNFYVTLNIEYSALYNVFGNKTLPAFITPYSFQDDKTKVQYIKKLQKIDDTSMDGLFVYLNKFIFNDHKLRYKPVKSYGTCLGNCVNGMNKVVIDRVARYSSDFKVFKSLLYSDHSIAKGVSLPLVINDIKYKPASTAAQDVMFGPFFVQRYDSIKDVLNNDLFSNIEHSIGIALSISYAIN